MTLEIDDLPTRVSYPVGATPQSAFVVPFAFFADADLKVYVDNVPKTLTTDYTVIGAGTSEPDARVVTLLVAVSNATVVISRDIEVSRSNDLATSGPIDIPAINKEFKRQIAIDQETRDKINRSIRQPDSDTDDLDELPVAADRANTFLGFNSSGQLVTATAVLASGGPTSALGDSLYGAADEAEARALLEVYSQAETDAAAAAAADAAVAAVETRQAGGRLTLVSGTPVMTSSQAAKTTIYYTPYVGQTVPVDGDSRVFTELSLALDSSNAHAGYHQSGKNFDLFVFDDAGTLRLGTGPAWDSNTARGTGGGTTELERYLGILVNKNSMTLRFGPVDGNTASADARAATYLGTFRASADGQTEFIYGAVASNGTAASLLLWNYYNRVEIGANVGDTTDSWAYTTTTIRPANNSATMRVSLVCGFDEDVARATFNGLASTSSARGSVGIGLDSTTAFSGAPAQFAIEAVAISTVASLTSRPGLGFHYFQALELGATGVTFYGDNGAPTTFQNLLSVVYRM